MRLSLVSRSGPLMPRRSLWAPGLVVAGLALGCLPVAAAQTPAPTAAQAGAAVPDPATAIKGSWLFNKALSKMPTEPIGGAPPATGRAARGGPPPDSEAARAQADLEKTPEMRQFRAAIREIQPPPEALFITASPTEVTFVTKDGTVRKFATDGVKTRMEISQSRMDVTTSWTGGGPDAGPRRRPARRSRGPGSCLTTGLAW